MRLFAAIGLSEEMRDQVKNVQERLRSEGVRGNFSPRENLHLTLAFLGENDDFAAVLAALKHVKFQSFTIETSRLGRFEGVWWIGFKECEALGRLASEVRRALDEAKIQYDRKPFRAHCTILRKPVFSGTPPALTLEPVSMRVERFTLYRSDRGARGMIYTELGSVFAQTIKS